MKIKKIFSRIMAAITALSFIFGLTIFISVLRANKGEVPSVFGFSVLRIQTGSMEPEYKTGSVIVAKKTDADDLKVGDVISFYSTNKDIAHKVNTHRIVEVNRLQSGMKEFVTKGDANSEKDEDPVLSTRVIGKVIFDFGVFSGSLIGILQNPKVIFFLIIVPLIIITFMEAVNLVNLFMDRNKTEEEDADENAGKRKD